MVATDGLENASRESTARDVKAVLDKQQGTYGWDYVFLGANQDAVLTGSELGFRAESSLTYGASEIGVAYATVALSGYVAKSRGGTRGGFTEEDRKGASGS